MRSPRFVRFAALLLPALLLLAGRAGSGPLSPAEKREKAAPPAAAARDSTVSGAGLLSRAGAERDSPSSSTALSKELDNSRQTALVTAARVAGECVVSIGAERTAYVRRGSLFDDSFLPFFFEAPVYQKYRQKTPYLGSGIALDKEGHIVTNHHVIEGADRVFVTLPNGKEYEAEIAEADPIADLAILKINAPGIKPAILGDSEDARPGEWVLAIGNPFGAALGDPCPTITAGVLSARNRFFRTMGEVPHLYEGMIQTDAAINPGNSGGALVNALGEVVGVNTFIFSESGGSIGIGFAIPINKVKRMLEEIRRYGRLRQARLDFTVIDITPYVMQSLSLSASDGVLVYRVEPRGPAMKAGIKRGDVITSINGRKVQTRREFLTHVLGTPVGETLRFEIVRQNKKTQTNYEVQAAPVK